MSVEAFTQTVDDEHTGYGDSMAQKADIEDGSFNIAAKLISAVALEALRHVPVVISYLCDDAIDGMPVHIARRPL